MTESRVVLKHRSATLGRIGKYIDKDNYTDVNLRGRLHPFKLSIIKDLWHYAAQDRILYTQAVKAKFTKYKEGTPIGPTWSTHWFRLDLDLSKDYLGKEVRLIWDSNTEGMVWEKGEPIQGLSGSPSSQTRIEFILSPNLKKSEMKRTLYIEMACNGMFGEGQGDLINPPNPNKTFSLNSADVVVVDKSVQKLLFDFEVLLMIAKDLSADSHRGNEAMYLANRMINTINLDDQATYKQVSEMADSFFQERNGNSHLTVHAMGHCHIDSAWLWPYAETIRKCARSWSAVLLLMDKYEDMTFACSQAAQYKWVQENYPTLFEKIRKRVKDGKFIPVGGTWVEMDGNVPSGESFVRQVLYGQRYFQREFGKRCTEFWLPDTFGYSAQLPQIVSQAGMSRFLTQKISWSVNKFPHHTFYWEGIDGTKVLTHFPPGDNYGMRCQVDELLKTVNNCEDKGRVKNLAYLYGYGDGGGGPTELMLERLKRLNNCDGIPVVEHSSPDRMFAAIEEQDVDNICRWIGELYLEFHQGTYTTQAKTKKFNRKCEFLLHDLEFFSAINTLLGNSHHPQEEIEKLWHDVLLNQFHDVLPGSSIHQVYVDSTLLYENVMASGMKMMEAQYTEFAMLKMDKKEKENAVLVMNTLGWDRRAVVETTSDVIDSPTSSSKAKKKRKLETPAGCQLSHDGKMLALVDVPSFGFMVLDRSSSPTEDAASVSEQQRDGEKVFVMENKELIAIVDSLGCIRSLKMRSNNREAVAKERLASQFVIFDDQPAYWDAWDLNHYHLETRKPIRDVAATAKIIENGPLRVAIQVSLKISSKSCIKQTVSMESTTKYIRFDTEVEWFESHKILKVQFPLNVRSQQATYDIQFGHLQRPTHQNTKLDWMKFEVGGHKWADLSEHGFGVTLMNDCKYGHSCIDNVLSLSLLKSAKAPDESADMGSHSFSYALRPHQGTLQSDGVIQDAYSFNCPLLTSTLPAVPANKKFSYISLSGDGAVVLETVKIDEDNVGWLVLRMFEAYGSHASATIHIKFGKVTQVQECNLLEEPIGENENTLLRNGDIEVALAPFKLHTIRCKVQI